MRRTVPKNEGFVFFFWAFSLSPSPRFVMLSRPLSLLLKQGMWQGTAAE